MFRVNQQAVFDGVHCDDIACEECPYLKATYTGDDRYDFDCTGFFKFL